MIEDVCMARVELEPEECDIDDASDRASAWIQEETEDDGCIHAETKISIDAENNELLVQMDDHLNLWLPLDKVEELIAASKKE